MKLNGNLELNSNGASEVRNLIIERLAVLPSVISNEKGRVVFNTTDGVYYYNNGTAWMAFATGGNATALQNEVDALETTIGGLVNADGSFNAAGASFSNVTTPTSLTNVLTQLDSAISGKDQLSELNDVTLASLANKQVLYYDSTAAKWVNHTLVLTDVSDITATAAEVNELTASGVVNADFVKLHAVTADAAELNILDGATLTTTELNYVDGVTSAIQTQLDNKQPLDAQLTSIASLTPAASDVLVGKADGTFELLTGAGFRASQGLVIGTDIQAWDADLDDIAAFAPAADSSENFSINGASYSKTGLNDIMVGTGGAEGSRWTLERGSVARDSLGLGDIATMDQAWFVRGDANASSSNIARDLSLNNYKLVNVANGTATLDAVNYGQLQAAIAGLSWKNSVQAATTANVDLATGGELTIDGVALVAGDRVLVKNQTAAAENGIYIVAAGAWTRSTDADAAAEVNGAAVYVEQGSAQQDTGWTVVSQVATLGTDAVSFVQFNGASGITAGIGLAKDGNTLNINLGAGIVELPSDEVGIDLYDPTTSALILSTTGSDRSTATNAKLHLLLDLTGNGKLVQSANGLKVTTNTITEAELTASVAGDGLTGGNGSALAVVSATGTASTGGDTPANWAGVGEVTVTADAVGATLGGTATTAAPGNHTHKAEVITFSNTASALAATTVQAAIDEVEGRVDTIETNAGNLLTEVNNVEAAVGLNTDGTFAAFTGTNYLNATTTMKGADVALDGAIKSLDTQVNGRISNMYFLYTGAAATSHTVTHNIGSKYCVVQVIDSADDSVIIPQSIVFDSTSQCTVTFNTSLACKIVVMGANPLV